MNNPTIDKQTGELLEGNNAFFQFYKHNFKMIRKLTKDNKVASELFCFMVEHMDGQNSLIVSQTALSEALEVSIRSVQYAVKYLAAHKYISILRTGHSSIYCINADIVWTKRANQKEYALFNSKVYLSKSEQEEISPDFKVKNEYKKVVKTVPVPKKIKTTSPSF